MQPTGHGGNLEHRCSRLLGSGLEQREVHQDVVCALCHGTSVLLGMERATHNPGYKVPVSLQPSDVKQWGWKHPMAHPEELFCFSTIGKELKTPQEVGVPQQQCVPLPSQHYALPRAAPPPSPRPAPGGSDEVEQRIVPFTHERSEPSATNPTLWD